MHFVSALVFTISGAALLVEPKLGPPGGPRKLRFDVVDSFTAMKYFPFSVAIWDPKDDATLKCVAEKRTEIDPVAQTATFVWLFPENEDSPAYEVPFYVTARGPGRVTFTAQDDPNQREGILYYTDRNCVVMDVEFYGHRKTFEVMRTAEIHIIRSKKIKDFIMHPLADRRRVVLGHLHRRTPLDLGRKHLGFGAVQGQTDDYVVRFLLEWLLWVVRKFKDSVPQVCIDQFADTCGVHVPEHSRDLCFDGEGDY